MVAPHNHLFDGGHRHTELFSQLAHGSVVIQAHHGVETRGGNIRGGGRSNNRVGVRRVTHHQNTHVISGVIVDGLALRTENTAVSANQIRTFHTLLTRHRTDQQAEVTARERHVGVVGNVDTIQQRESAVIQFHGSALGSLQSRGDFQHFDTNRLIRAEHFAGGDAEYQRVSDIASSTGDGNIYRTFSH